MMHWTSMKCGDRAEALIALGDEESLRYACLELRMAIEHLFYDWIPSYEEELPTDILKRWRPQQVMDALLACDPHIEGGGSVEIRQTEGDLIAAFEFKGISKRLIKEYWHKLGSYLHATMPGVEVDWERARPFLAKTLEAIRVYGNERAMVNMGRFVRFECTCGRPIKRKIQALEASPHVVCPDVQCRQVWQRGAENQMEVVMTWFCCSECHARTDVEEREKAEGNVMICVQCGAQFKVERQLVLEKEV